MLDGQGVLGADIDVAMLRPDRVGRDEHPFENQVGVSFEHASIHEGAGVSLIRITDDVFHVAPRAAGETPFLSRGKARAAAASQSRLFNLVDHPFGGHRKEDLAQCGIPAAGHIVPDLRRIDPAVVAEDLPHLAFIERNVVIVGDHPARCGIDVEQPLDRLFLKERFRHDLRYIGDRYLLVEDLLGEDDDDRSPFAEAVAAGAHHIGLSLEALLPDFVDKGKPDLLPSPGPAPCSAADRHARLLRVSRFKNRFSKGHQIPIGFQLQRSTSFRHTVSAPAQLWPG